MPARSSSWTREAYAGGQAGDYVVLDEYFEYDGVLWKQAWDYEHQCYCWCIVDPPAGPAFRRYGSSLGSLSQ